MDPEGRLYEQVFFAHGSNHSIKVNIEGRITERAKLQTMFRGDCVNRPNL